MSNKAFPSHRTEIQWFDAKLFLPDGIRGVLIHHQDYGVLIGHCIHGLWRMQDGDCLEVTHWAEWPEGPKK